MCYWLAGIMRFFRNVRHPRLAHGAAVLATVAALGAPAHAVYITVNGVNWDVSTTTVPGCTQVSCSVDVGTFSSTFITSQPWSGNSTTAGAFAVALGAQLGYPNDQQFGPFFAYAAVPDSQSPGGAIYQSAGVISSVGSYQFFQPPSTETYTYASATLVTTDVPGPLPLLGGMAAFGWSRRLRRRVSLAPSP